MRYAFLLAAFLSGALAAQSWQVYDMDNAGLPSNTIKALVQDASGMVWAATDWGLCRFDGMQWTTMQQTEVGLPENNITALAVDAQDRLWVGTAFSGVAILDAGTWSYLTMDNSEIPDNSIHGITHDHRGWAWISTSLGLACDTGSGWRVYDNTASSHLGFEFFSPNVRKVVVRADELVCVATMNGGLTYLTEDDFVYYTTFNSNFFDNSANAIVLDSNGDRWLASAAAGLIRHAGSYMDNVWFNYNAQNSNFPDNTLTSLVIDGADTKYAGTEIGGIIVYPSNGNWSTLDMLNSGLPDNRVLSLLIDNAGILWAGTNEGGVARWDPASGLESGNDLRNMPHVFPSPFTHTVQVQWNDQRSHHDHYIIDVAGRVVHRGTTNGERRTELELGHLSEGLHFLIIDRTGGRDMVKLVKMR